MAVAGAHKGLSITGLRKVYSGGIRALDGIDLHIGPGMYGLLGPNGAGKSTLMRTLATLQRPDTGSIVMDGLDVLSKPEPYRQKLGYLPQHIGAYPGVSGYELLRRFVWLKGFTDRKACVLEVQRLLEKVNLSHAARRPVSTYSGGMLRRFGIALALIGSPSLLIVDEPTAGLDPEERNRFHRVLSEVASISTVLLSTHIVEDIENLCRNVAIINHGKIIASGATTDLISRWIGRIWTKVFLRGEALPEDALQLSACPDGTRVVIESHRLPDDGYSAKPPNLEDIYYIALRDSAHQVASL